MTPPRWIIPLDPGPDGGGPAIVVQPDDQLRVNVEQRHAPNGRLPLLSSLVACQLGQALQDASTWCGQERARRDARKGRAR